MLLILVGKSGCGKSTIETHFEKMISFTTRSKRENETHGKDYYFYNKDVVDAAIEKRKKGEQTFIKQLSSYNGHHYGTSEEEVHRIKTMDLVMAVMNIEGAKDMKQIMTENGVETKIIWIDVDETVRIQRIIDRSTQTGENEEQLKERLQEDERDLEKEDADIILYNHGTLDDILKEIHKFAS